MGNYSLIFKFIIASAFIAFPVLYTNAEDFDSQAESASEEALSPLERIQSAFQNVAGDVITRGRNRSNALKFVSKCESLDRNSNNVDVEFCETSQSQLQVTLAGRYAFIIDGKVREKVREKVKECRSLLRMQKNIETKISEIRSEIEKIEGKIDPVIKSLEVIDLTGVEGKDDDEKTKKFYAQRRKILDDLEFQTQLYESNIQFLQTGTGEPPYERDGPNLSYIKGKMDDSCGMVVVRPDDFSEEERSSSRLSVRYDPGMPATKAEVTVEVEREIVELSSEVNAEKTVVSTGNEAIERAAQSAITLIHGSGTDGTGGATNANTGSNPDVTGVYPQIQQARTILTILEDGLRRGGSDRNLQGGATCTGLDCPPQQAPENKTIPTSPAPPTTTVATTPAGTPNDGLGYGGSTGSSTQAEKTGSTRGDGVLAKTGSGFSMPSLGGFGSNKNGVSPSYGSTHSASVGRQGNVGSATMTRNWNGGSNTHSNNFNARTRTERSPSSTEKTDSQYMAMNHPSGVAQNAGAAGAGLLVGQAGNESGVHGDSGQRVAKAAKRGNKQLHTSRNEHSGSGSSGLLQNEKNRRANLDARMEKLKSENKQAGKDAFDPDKYIPKTRAERLALARASGKLAGYADGTAWPNDISRLRDQNIFNLMGNGYKRHLK